MTQKALIVRTGPDGHEGLRELNVELEQGWRVARVAPMGGAAGPAEAPCHAALVILERADDRTGPTLAVKALEQVGAGHESVERVVENGGEVVEDNGTGPPDERRP